MFRLWYMTFFGEPRARDAHPHHATPASMRGPMVILACFLVCGGWIGIERFGAYPRARRRPHCTAASSTSASRTHPQPCRRCSSPSKAGSSPTSTTGASPSAPRSSPPPCPAATSCSPTSTTSTRSTARSSSSRCSPSRDTCSAGSSTPQSSAASPGCSPASPASPA